MTVTDFISFLFLVFMMQNKTVPTNTVKSREKAFDDELQQLNLWRVENKPVECMLLSLLFLLTYTLTI